MRMICVVYNEMTFGAITVHWFMRSLIGQKYLEACVSNKIL